MPTIGDKQKFTCTARDFGIVKSESDTPSEYSDPPSGEWWGPAHPDFGSASGKKHAEGMIQPYLGKDRKPVYKTGLTSMPKFLNWFNTDPRPLNKAGKTPINMELPLELEMEWTTAGWSYDGGGNNFFPLDGKGFHAGSSSNLPNYHFTLECQYRFLYQGGETVTFNGNDDAWIFINGKLLIDLGGLHGSMGGAIDLTTITDLVQGKSYDLSIFYAERHAKKSNFKLVTSLITPPLHDFCFRAATSVGVAGTSTRTYTFTPMLSVNRFPLLHKYMTRTTCGGNVYKTTRIPSSGPSFSPGCNPVTSAELLFALNSLKGGSDSPIAKEKQVMILTIIDGTGDIYIMMQGGSMPSGTTANTFVIDVSVDVGTSTTAAAMVEIPLNKYYSPGQESTQIPDPDPEKISYDLTKIHNEKQRLTMSWGVGSVDQTSGLIYGPFRGIGQCVGIKVIDKGSTETYAVGSMDSTTGEITELVVSEASVDQNDGIVVCAHGCNDVCVQHDDCLTCKADATCGWSFDKGCFEYDTSMITGLEKTGTCVDPTAPAPRMGPDGKIHFGPADMFDTPSPGGWIGGKKGPPLDLGVIAIVLAVLFCGGCLCLGIFYWWCCINGSKKEEKMKEKEKNSKPNAAVGIQMNSNPMGGGAGSRNSHQRTQTKLPNGWISEFDESNYKFYRNTLTGEVTWDSPAGSVGGTAALSAALASAQASVGHSHQQSVLPAGWARDFDVSGQKYYVSNNGEFSWDKPLPVGWSEAYDAANAKYYTQKSTGVVQWERPV